MAGCTGARRAGGQGASVMRCQQEKLRDGHGVCPLTGVQALCTQPWDTDQQPQRLTNPPGTHVQS